MSASIDIDNARRVLLNAWKRTDDLTIKGPDLFVRRAQVVLTAKDVTYKYILITGLLGKICNEDVHPRALQAGSSLPGAYDARSLCHKVVVPFEKTQGNLWGLSNEPFLNKPARHPEHDKSNNQLKNSSMARITHDLLEEANDAASWEDVFKMLVSCLRISKATLSNHIEANEAGETNLSHVVKFATEFLKSSDGGSRLVAIVGTFAKLFHSDHQVKIYSANVADKFGKTAGDIEIYHDRRIVTAFECKQRPMNLDDVRHGIRKAKEHQLREYCFVLSHGYTVGHEFDINEELRERASELDLSVVDIHKVIMPWAIILNPIKRARFGEVVTTILSKEMRRDDIADTAATLWNSIE